MKPNLFIFGACEMTWQICRGANAFDCHVIANEVQVQKPVGNYSSFHQAVRDKNIDLTVIEDIVDWKIPKPISDDMPVLMLSIGAPWFFKKAFLNNFQKHPIYNLHGTHLPKDRGGNLFSWLIMNGQRTGICLLHELTEEIDAGAIVDFEEFIYPKSCHKPKDYICVYEQKNIAFVHKFFDKWLNNNFIAPIASQPAYLSTYWPRLMADIHGWINWSWSAVNIERFICAFDSPYNGARCRWREKVVILKDAYSQSTDGFTHPFQAGLIYRNNRQWLSIAANDGEIIVCSVCDEKGNSLLAEIKEGDRFYSLTSDLEKANLRVMRSKSGLSTQPKFS